MKTKQRHQSSSVLIEPLTLKTISHQMDRFKNLMKQQSMTQDISPKDVQQRLRRTISQGGQTYIAYDARNKALGTVTMIIEPKFARNQGKVGHLEDFRVHDSTRYHAIKGALLQSAITHAQGHDCYKVILNCSEVWREEFTPYGFAVVEQHMKRDLQTFDTKEDRRVDEIDYKITHLRPGAYDTMTGLFETLRCLTNAPDVKQEKVKETLQQMIDQDMTTYVALTKDNDIVGTLKLMVEQKLYTPEKVGHIEDVVTREAYEGQGIQKALIKQAAADAYDKGCKYLALDCNEKNIPYYEQRGFERVLHCMRLDL